MLSRIAFCLFIFFFVSSRAQQSDIFVCVQPDGTKIYQNIAQENGCRRLLIKERSETEGGAQMLSRGRSVTNSQLQRFDTQTIGSFSEARVSILKEELRKSQNRADLLRVKREKSGDLTKSESQELSRLEDDIRALTKELNAF